ncbi:MAG: histidine triad nucleotide-binding protein [Chloroflexi bacterium]|nr:histidine triad nucleotide-binding protein [Chloroflexota bacterium]
MDCIFCQIASGKIPGEILYQDEELVAFPDKFPQAPVHILIIPKKHIASLAELSQAETPIIGRMADVANQMARKKGVFGRGYRLVINCGKEGGQIVPHLHMHLLGGKQLPGKLA